MHPSPLRPMQLPMSESDFSQSGASTTDETEPTKLQDESVLTGYQSGVLITDSAATEPLDDEPVFTRAQYPFDDSEGSDTILRSVDNVGFYVYRIILSVASPVLKDMLAQLPQATSGDRSKPVVDVPETSQTLHALLCLCYPLADHSLSSPAFVGDVLEAALKYDIKVAIKAMKMRLHELAKDQPLHVYAVACQFSLEDTASLAARTWRNLQPRPANTKQADWAKTIVGSSYDEEMTTISAGSFYRLVEFVRAGVETSFCEHKGTAAPLPNHLSNGLTASTSRLDTSSTSKRLPTKAAIAGNASTTTTTPTVLSPFHSPASILAPAITLATSTYAPSCPFSDSSSKTELRSSSSSFAPPKHPPKASTSSPFYLDPPKVSTPSPFRFAPPEPSTSTSFFSFGDSSTSTAEASPYAIDLSKPSTSSTSSPKSGFSSAITAVKQPSFSFGTGGVTLNENKTGFCSGIARATRADSSTFPAAKPLSLTSPPKSIRKTPTAVSLSDAKVPSSLGSTPVSVPATVPKVPSSTSSSLGMASGSEPASVTESAYSPPKHIPDTTTTSVTTAKETYPPHNHLFKFDDSDLEIETLDGGKFSVHHVIVRLAAPKMVESMKVTSDGKNTLSLPECSRTVSILLQICYPCIVAEKELTQSEVSVALEAAAKYGVKKAVHKLVSLLAFTNPKDVLKAYIMLAQNDFADEAGDVARNEVLLFADLSAFYVPEMENITAQLYYSLLEYRNGCLSCRYATHREQKLGKRLDEQIVLSNQSQAEYKLTTLLDEQNVLLKQNIAGYTKSLPKWIQTQERKALGRKLIGLEL